MRKDYHMHPTVLATPERFDQFVQQALKQNVGEICVIDHMPLSISKASDRLPAGSIGAYCAQVRELAKRYEGVIGIKCGIEIDYHPSVLDEIEAVLTAGKFDYILASSHMHAFIKDYPNHTFNEFASAAIENSLKAVETGWFSAVAHMDMYRFPFVNPKRFPLVDDGYTPERHETEIKALLDEIVKRNMYLEINPHLAEGQNDLFYTYPQDRIMEWAYERNLRFSYGSDAHKPHSVGVLLDELEGHPFTVARCRLGKTKRNKLIGT